ncbi:transmembrane protein [Pararhizobium polonicum]|uniref:Lectin-like protein BA14k n=1 Tax=Pararhizobium polonicum TaxID=1612624 RepID=A0A1C7NVC3_9HYPH|nr:BA14K family protein [Pararhizobium polonicum]OBZ92963.1 transmembrane protein [Pararhizobium polonicum]
MGVFGLKLAPLALSAVLLATSFTPSQAFVQIPVPVKAERVSDVDNVQYRQRGNDDWRRRHGFNRRGNEAFYNGHRGYRERRHGYRQHNGMWFPLGAFAAGAIIGGAMADRPAPRYGGSHVEWCANRYRSYRAYDNSYQPNYGPRRACVSPY